MRPQQDAAEARQSECKKNQKPIGDTNLLQWSHARDVEDRRRQIGPKPRSGNCSRSRRTFKELPAETDSFVAIPNVKRALASMDLPAEAGRYPASLRAPLAEYRGRAGGRSSGSTRTFNGAAGAGRQIRWRAWPIPGWQASSFNGAADARRQILPCHVLCVLRSVRASTELLAGR
jgi:hypothetical protein